MDAPPPASPPAGAPPPGPGGLPPGYYPPPPGYPSGYYPPPKKASLLWLWILLGILGGVFVLGILAAIAIPSFLDYQKKAKRSEAELNLNAIGKAATRAFYETAAFPTGSSGPTPLASCCTAPTRRCAPDAAAWMVEPWSSLDFEQVAPHHFSYTYTGAADGQSFTATATGDLDCDGTTIVYTVSGTADGGAPNLVFMKPTNRD